MTTPPRRPREVPRRRSPPPEPQNLPDDEALELITEILQGSWPEFQELRPDPSSPSGWRNPTDEEQEADKQKKLADAKAAARDADWWPLVKMLVNNDDLDDEARDMLGLRALVGIRRKQLTDEAFKWIQGKLVGSTEKFPRLEQPRSEQPRSERTRRREGGRPKFRDLRNLSPAVQAKYHLPVFKEILREYHSTDYSKPIRDIWARKLVLKYFNINDGALTDALKHPRDPRWKIDLERFRAHLRWLRHTEQHRHLFT